MTLLLWRFGIALALIGFASILPATVGAQCATYLLQWGSFGGGEGQFDSPEFLAIDAQGNVYVTERDNHRVQKFTSTGNFLCQWGSLGSDPGQFNWAMGVATDANGNVYVADRFNNRIQKFWGGTCPPTFICEWGVLGSAPGEFNYPAGVATDAAGNIYVADTDNYRIQKFWGGTCPPTFIGEWGSPGNGNGQFSDGQVVWADGSDVYVSDATNNRIQKFSNNGTYLTQWGSNGTGNGQFEFPLGMATDADGNIYVADAGNNRIQMFTGTGNGPYTYVCQWGEFGTGNGQFYGPSGLALDTSGNIYVSEDGNDRVQKFGPSPVSIEPTSWGRMKSFYR